MAENQGGDARIELNSPTPQFCKICQLRIQFNPDGVAMIGSITGLGFVSN